MTWIKVLAPSRREKGLAFELLTRQILDAWGLAILRTRLKVTGAGPLLELRGTRRGDAVPYVGEGCALSREVTLEEVKSFFRRFRRERRRSKRLRGVFLSCTPFSRNVLAWHHDLGDEVRQAFELLGPDGIVARLVETRRLGDLTEVDAAIAASSTLPPGSRFLHAYGGRLYWVHTLMIHRRPKAYVVLEGSGSAAPLTIAREMKRLDTALRDKRLLDLGLRERILRELLTQESPAAEEVARAIGEQPQETLVLLQWLEKEGVVASQRATRKSRKFDRFRLQRSFPIFLHLARLFLPGPHRFRFLASPFASQMIRSGLASYLEERFRLKFPAEDCEAITHVLSISPAALSFALWSPQNYVVSAREMEAKLIPDGERDVLREAARTRFVNDLSFRAVTDILHEEFPLLLRAHDVRVHLARIQLKASILRHPLFSLRGVHLHTLPEGKPATPEHALEIGAVMRLIQEYDQAIEYLDEAIRELKDPARLKSAWNNKGLCFFNKRRYQEGIECFNEAIRLDNNLKQAWFNKAACLREVGDSLGALRCVQRALEIDPAYKEARDLFHRLQA